MKTTKHSELASRWQTDIGIEFVKNLWTKAYNNITSSPFGIVESNNRIDLRGLPFPKRTLHQIKLVGVDLTGANFEQTWIQQFEFEDVVFDKANFSNFADHGNVFVRCSFIKTNFRRAILGYRGSRYVDCHFIQANFRSAGFIRPEFDHVHFDHCHFDGVDFNGSSFNQCQFAGCVKNTWFRGSFPLASNAEHFGKPRPNKMETVSFEYAELVGTTFSDGCDLSTIILPNSIKYRKFDHWIARLGRAMAIIAQWPENERKEAEIFCKTHSYPNQDWWIINTEELALEYGENVAKRLLEVLRAYPRTLNHD